MDKRNKLPISAKLGFGIADFGKNCLIIFNTYFLLYFYTDVIQISPAVAASILAIARVWDAINDPMMGVLVDKTKSKEGKCRFYLKYFSVPAGVCLFLSYFVPELSDTSKMIWVAVTYIFQGMATTITSVSLNTMLARLTDDREERVSLGQYKAVGSIIANLIIPAISLPFVMKVGGASMQKGFAIVAAVYGVAYAICHLAAFFATKGYEKSYEEETAENAGVDNTSVSIITMLGVLFKNNMLFLVCISYLIYLAYVSLMGSTIVFYLQYNIKNTNLMSLYSVVGTATAIIPILIMKQMAKKCGNAKTIVIACILTAIQYLIRFVTKDSSMVILGICWGIEGIGLGIFGNMIFQCVLDSMIYGKWKTGVDNQAVVMSVFTFFQKFGQAIGGVIAAAVLGLVPYVGGAETQEKAVLDLFFAENITIPMIAVLVMALLAAAIVKMEKEIPRMLNEIEAREVSEKMSE